MDEKSHALKLRCPSFLAAELGDGPASELFVVGLRLSTLPVEKLKKTRRIQRRKKFRNVNLRALKDAERILLVVFVKDVQ